MNKAIATLGIVLVLISGFLFLITFSGGSLGSLVVTGTNPTANFLAFLFVIVFLPIGSGLAFFGLAFRRPMMAAGTQVVYKGSPGVAKAALALAIIALLIGAGAFAMLLTTESSQDSQISSLTSQVNQLKTSGVAAINKQPGVIAYKVDWSNTDPTGQDRFNPENILVVQGDIVQIMFIHNDTDAHTFTIISSSSPYGFQINDTITGMRNFLTNLNYAGSCVNGTYTQDTTNLAAGVSSVYCVSGSSLLSPTQLSSHGASDFVIAQNPNPAEPLTPGNASGNPQVTLVSITNQVFYSPDNTNQAIQYGNNSAEVYGVGAFQASQPGVYEFFCHYHVSNGMFGYITVLPNAYCTTNAQACGITSSS
ncbi:MAG: hypothetical protein JRN20_20690 [Nitrososphaerota archaeon]|nr:hypothetical protein [Nitrososphaerota archaeon]